MCLGHGVSQGTQKLTLKFLESSFSIPLPQMREQLCKFLGTAGYCHQWIPNFAVLAKPLYTLLPDNIPEPIVWLLEGLTSFEASKLILSTRPILGLPNFDKLFHLYCHENNGLLQVF